ncbi:hypothetical protein [Streptomyces sp. NBC_01014]|uniref:hypothetical protein n=1 Tax=Streptomyces sp. NBC_01014 TaxID=2903719 RepID=UPI003087535E|nr:hypothetical protein OIE60_21950 [Streptomyces sp. NBC_01766]WSV55984.1 hypothetical protein OG282_21045 [Streptomyces sp. NBC_01014]
MEAYASLREIPVEFLTIFCLTCAERGSGVFNQLSESEQIEWFSQVLNSAWKASLGGASEDELIDILEDFELRYGTLAMDDPDSKEFCLVQAATLAVNAIAVHLNPSAARAEMSGQTLETILGSFDFRLNGSKSVITRRDTQDSSIGRLQQLEQDSQKSTIESIRALTSQGISGLTPAFLEDLRNSCGPARDKIALATEDVADMSGWATS